MRKERLKGKKWIGAMLAAGLILSNLVAGMPAAAVKAAENEETIVQGELNIEKVDNLSSDFIMGMDISSAIAELDSGVVYRDYEGNALSGLDELCSFLKSNGITHLRIRVWNDPYDADGHGYGGGNNDVEKAKRFADACRNAGLKLLVDFHCSDLWTDPGKQRVPKAWKDDTLEEKQEALKQFLTESLETIDPTKDVVDMVQVGNETTSGFIGETSTESMCRLFSSGAEGVKAYNDQVKVVIHVTNPEKGNVTKWAKNLDENNVAYDILATSYYPYWHGSLDHLKSELSTVKETYKKDVLVAETSYAYTLQDSDGHDNTVREGNNDKGDNILQPFSEQGQATAVRNLIDTVNQAGGLGVFYWEPAWITVGDTTGLEGEAKTAQIDANKEKWETFGSGWASSYAAEYGEDEGTWWGGSAVDNEAMFYPDGTATAALHVWEYVKTGAQSSHISVDGIDKAQTVSVYAGEALPALPETVKVSYSTGDVQEPVTWNQEDIDKIDAQKAGTYVVNGEVTLSKTVDQGDYAGKTVVPVTYTINVMAKNLITDAEDAGLEKGDNFTHDGGAWIGTFPSASDVVSGSGCLHWWSETPLAGKTLRYEKEIELNPGSYSFEATAHGNAGDKVALQILNTENKVLLAGSSASLTGWQQYVQPKTSFTVKETVKVKLQVSVDIQAGGWGSVDDLYLHEEEGDFPILGEGSTEEPENPNPPDTDDTHETGGEGGNTTKPEQSADKLAQSVQTGDEASPATWAILLFFGGVAVVSVMSLKREVKIRRKK